MSEPNIGGSCAECGQQYEHRADCSKAAKPTEQAQNEAIAKWMGWEPTKGKEPFRLAVGHLAYTPDFVNDLNAIHEATVTLLKLDVKGSIYILYLWEITGQQARVGSMHLLHPNVLASEMFALHHATAAQRCEALLKTLQLWTP